jgi:hypothetical protein
VKIQKILSVFTKIYNYMPNCVPLYKGNSLYSKFKTPNVSKIYQIHIIVEYNENGCMISRPAWKNNWMNDINGEGSIVTG